MNQQTDELTGVALTEACMLKAGYCWDEDGSWLKDADQRVMVVLHDDVQQCLDILWPVLQARGWVSWDMHYHVGGWYTVMLWRAGLSNWKDGLSKTKPSEAWCLAFLAAMEAE